MRIVEDIRREKSVTGGIRRKVTLTNASYDIVIDDYSGQVVLDDIILYTPPLPTDTGYWVNDEWVV